MTLFALFVLILLASADQDTDDQQTIDACNSVVSLLDATGKAVPFVPLAHTMYSLNMAMIGYERRTCLKHKINEESHELANELKQAFEYLIDRLNELEDLINDRFNELEAFIDRKQFESDITDPATILWSQTIAFLNSNTTSNKTLHRLEAECLNETPWKLAMKIYNRLYGPDNTLMTQVRGDHYSNVSFMHTKDMIMYRMFQMVSVQAICLGLEYGQNYDVTRDWEMQRMDYIYNAIVENIIEMRKKQENDYFEAEMQEVARQGEAGGGSNVDIEKRIRVVLTDRYPWDKFFVNVFTRRGCDDRFGFAWNNTDKVRAYYYWSGNKVIEIARFWPRNLTTDEYNHYSQRISDAVSHEDCGVPDLAWHIFPADSTSVSLSIFWADQCNVEQSIDKSGFSGAEGVVWAGPWEHVHSKPPNRALGIFETFTLFERPGDIAYDLGFWVRDLNATDIMISTTPVYTVDPTYSLFSKA